MSGRVDVLVGAVRCRLEKASEQRRGAVQLPSRKQMGMGLNGWLLERLQGPRPSIKVNTAQLNTAQAKSAKYIRTAS